LTTWLALTALVMARALSGSREERRFVVASYVAALALLALASIEALATAAPMFKSDEIYYLEGARQSVAYSVDPDRWLWFVVNRLLTEWDFGLNGFALKLINIPLFVATCLSLNGLVKRPTIMLNLWLLMPYYVWISTFNFRDTLVLLLTVTVFASFFNGSRILLPGVSLLCLFLLRPAMAALNVLLWAVLMLRDASRAQRLAVLRLGLLIALGIGAAAVSWSTIAPRINQTIAWVAFTTGEGKAERLQEFDAEAVDPTTARGFGIGLARYVLAPLPTSLLLRAADGGSSTWGIVDDLVRAVHQTLYLLALAVLVLRPVLAWRGLAAAPLALRLLVLSLAAYAPVYSLHLFGAVHSRSKIPFQLAVFIVVALTFPPHRDSVSEQDGGRPLPVPVVN